MEFDGWILGMIMMRGSKKMEVRIGSEQGAGLHSN